MSRLELGGISLGAGVWCLALLAMAWMSPAASAAVPASPSKCYAAALSATATNATVEIYWNDNSTNETQWKIQYSTNNWATSSSVLVNSGASSTSTGAISYPWPLAALNTSYRFRVVAVNASGSSGVSNVATVGTFNFGAPLKFSATAVDPFNVIMSWEEVSTAESGFALEYKIGNGVWEYFGSTGANAIIVDPINLIHPLESYAFRVRAFKGGAPATPDSPADANVSAYSNVVTLTTAAYPLSAAMVPCQTAVNLSWPNILNESGYQILYKEASETEYQEYGLLSANVSDCKVTLPADAATKSYSFIVRPYVVVSGNDANLMGESAVASATVDVPAEMTSTSGSSGTPGSPFSHSFIHVSAATISSRTLTGIPTGLVFNSTSGVLSGVYPTVGNYTLTYALRFTSGSTLIQKFHIRVRRPAGPPAVATIIPVWNAMVGNTRDTPLAGTFVDHEADSAVRVSTTLGDMDFILFNGATPATVANFMSYVNAGKYTDVAFHRSIPGFVIQSGGFKGEGNGSNFTSVLTLPPVVNEPGIANERGTISMAKSAGDPNSATSQFFVSLADNRGNLDYQNGGFTVFGRVAGNGMEVASAISSLPVGTFDLLLDGNSTATSFEDFPMNATTLPEAMYQTQLVKMHSVAAIPTLTYSITGNTQPSIASASLSDGQLRLTALAPGQTTISVTATDLDNLSTTQSVTVNLVNKTVATVKLSGLAQVYTGAAKSAIAVTMPAGLAVQFTYNGSYTPPTEAGSYAVVATINNTKYQGTATGTLVISKAAATVALSTLSAVYSGTAKSVKVITRPAGLPVEVTYKGSATMPIDAGVYPVVATINAPNHQGKAMGTLVIAKAVIPAAQIQLGNLAAIYDGTPKVATALTTPGGLAVAFTYKGLAVAPVNVGIHPVIGTIMDTNYQGKAAGNLVISKATAALALDNLATTYNGLAKTVTVITSPAGLPVKITYNGSTTAPRNAGTYAVAATVVHANYQGSANAVLVISKADATIQLGNLAAIYNGIAKPATAVTTPPRLAVALTYDGLPAVPKNAGTYAVEATIVNANYQGSTTGNLVISKASALLKLGSLAAVYNGTPKAVTTSTTPAGLPVTITYDGLAAVPVAPGSYAVVATVNHANYQGGATGTLVIAN